MQRIEEALKLLVEDRKSLRSRIDKLKRSIDKLENAPRDQNFDSDMRELTSERQALMALVNQINNKQTLNFLTDEGLLPNYAFRKPVLRYVLCSGGVKKAGKHVNIKTPLSNMNARHQRRWLSWLR